jgi:hypothetical protein
MVNGAWRLKGEYNRFLSEGKSSCGRSEKSHALVARIHLDKVQQANISCVAI